jgi:hypothetical protein
MPRPTSVQRKRCSRYLLCASKGRRLQSAPFFRETCHTSAWNARRSSSDSSFHNSLSTIDGFLSNFGGELAWLLVGATSHCRPCRLKFIGGRHNNVIPTKREYLLLFCWHHVGGQREAASRQARLLLDHDCRQPGKSVVAASGAGCAGGWEAPRLIDGGPPFKSVRPTSDSASHTVAKVRAEHFSLDVHQGRHPTSRGEHRGPEARLAEVPRPPSSAPCCPLIAEPTKKAASKATSTR